MNTNTTALASSDSSESPPQVPSPKQDSPHDDSQLTPTSAVNAEVHTESSPDASASPSDPPSPEIGPSLQSPTLSSRDETTPPSSPSTSEGSVSGDNSSLPIIIPGAPFDIKRWSVKIPLQSIDPAPPWREEDLPKWFYRRPVVPPFGSASPESPEPDTSSRSSAQSTNKEEKE